MSHLDHINESQASEIESEAVRALCRVRDVLGENALARVIDASNVSSNASRSNRLRWSEPPRSWVSHSPASHDKHLLENLIARSGLEPLTQKLGTRFVEMLRSWVSEDEFEEIRLRNATEDNPHVCHSHDFADANEAMAQVFQELGLSVDDVRLWTAAWTYAKATYLTAPPGATPANKL